MEKGAGEGMLGRRDGKLESQNGDGKEFKVRRGWRATSNQPLHSLGWICELPTFHPRDSLSSGVAVQKLCS